MDQLTEFYPKIIPFRFPGLGNVHCAFTTAFYGNISMESAPSPEEDVIGYRAKALVR
mgnify:CR=1 FL=1